MSENNRQEAVISFHIAAQHRKSKNEMQFSRHIYQTVQRPLEQLCMPVELFPRDVPSRRAEIQARIRVYRAIQKAIIENACPNSVADESTDTGLHSNSPCELCVGSVAVCLQVRAVLTQSQEPSS